MTSSTKTEYQKIFRLISGVSDSGGLLSIGIHLLSLIFHIFFEQNEIFVSVRVKT